MKRLALLICACASLALFAQEEPSAENVLNTARDKYQASQSGSAQPGTNQSDAAAFSSASGDNQLTGADTSATGNELILPFMIGFVPGIQFPGGYSSVAFGGFVIGGAVNNVYGFTASGVFSIAQDIYGFQGAGAFTIAQHVYGFQGAGIFNLAEGLAGTQAAGIFNIASNSGKAVQVAGIFNISGGSAGVQTAGIFNIAQDVQGVQIAGIFNQAHKVSGVQVGLINIADSVQGLQVGVINISHDGINTVGSSYEPDTRLSTLFWRNGSSSLYTIIQGSLPYEAIFKPDVDMLCSAGLGTRIGSRQLYLDADISKSIFFSKLKTIIYSALNNNSADAALLNDASFITARLTLGSKIFGFNMFIGWRYDIEQPNSSLVPELLKTGTVSSIRFFGTDYAVYRRWFFGLSL